MKNILILIIFLFLNGCISDLGKEEITEAPNKDKDTLALSKDEYEKFRKSLLIDTSFISLVFKSLPADNIEAQKLRKLINTEYENRLDSTEFTSGEIDSIFYTLRTFKSLKNKFDSIDKSLIHINKNTLKESNSLIQRIKESKGEKQ